MSASVEISKSSSDKAPLAYKQALFYNGMRSGNEGSWLNRRWRRVRHAFRDVTFNATEARMKKEIDTFIGDLSGKMVLEVGTGAGAPDTFRRMAKAEMYVACDISWETLRTLKSKTEDQAAVHFVVMDALQPCFKKGRFDVVVAMGMVHHLNAPGTVGKLFRELLISGGYYVVCDPMNTEPLIRLARALSARWRPNLELEFPLRVQDLQFLTDGQHHESRYYYCLSKFLLPLFAFNQTRKEPIRTISHQLDRLDVFLTQRYGLFRRLSWIVLLKGWDS